MASYGPAVDSNLREEAARLWTSDGIYDVDVGEWHDQDAIASMLGEAFHQACLAAGCSHHGAGRRGASLAHSLCL